MVVSLWWKVVVVFKKDGKVGLQVHYGGFVVVEGGGGGVVFCNRFYDEL